MSKLFKRTASRAAPVVVFGLMSIRKPLAWPPCWLTPTQESRLSRQLVHNPLTARLLGPAMALTTRPALKLPLTILSSLKLTSRTPPWGKAPVGRGLKCNWPGVRRSASRVLAGTEVGSPEPRLVGRRTKPATSAISEMAASIFWDTVLWVHRSGSTMRISFKRLNLAAKVPGIWMLPPNSKVCVVGVETERYWLPSKTSRPPTRKRMRLRSERWKTEPLLRVPGSLVWSVKRMWSNSMGSPVRFRVPPTVRLPVTLRSPVTEPEGGTRVSLAVTGSWPRSTWELTMV